MCMCFYYLFITSVFGYLSAVQASIELVEMIELWDLLCRAGTIDEWQCRVEGGGVVTRVKDGCHTEPGLKVGQLSEGQPGDKELRYQKASESAV